MAILSKLELRGFKSIKDASLELRPLNILIGSNGAGKSNLISYFKLLNEMMGGRLQQHIAKTGHAQAILHFGPKVTPQLDATLELKTQNGVATYHMRMSYAAGDTLVLDHETVTYSRDGLPPGFTRISLGSEHRETSIKIAAENGESTAKVFRHFLEHCRVYHFHDTSPTSRMQQHCYIEDNRWLMHDAGNLAAILFRLREQEKGIAYNRIVSTIRQIAPFFDDFELQPSGPYGKDIILNWKEAGSEQVFGPHQLSDGTLRAICLVTLLLQPEKDLPDLIVVDEPELGLHPYALQVVGSLLRRASSHAQILVSTQSSAFLDNFEPEDIIVVERNEQGTTFIRPDEQALREWLRDYSLGETWEKNVIGGGPH